MTNREIGWREAILTVFEDADAPLKYDVITQMMGERGRRTLTGATPADMAAFGLYWEKDKVKCNPRQILGRTA